VKTLIVHAILASVKIVSLAAKSAAVKESQWLIKF
jgi:hypothetical protein